jgi:hypothetical protein
VPTVSSVDAQLELALVVGALEDLATALESFGGETTP